MRILFNNLIDGLAASNISALTEEALYEASRVQDQRLTTRWHTTSPTSQTIIFAGSCDTIVGGNIGLVTGSAATNLITNPEDFSQASWVKSDVTASVYTSIVGVPSNLITATWAGDTYIRQDLITTASTYTISYTLRKGNMATCQTLFYNTATASILGNVLVFFNDKSITYATGSEAMPATWIDDETVRLYLNPAQNTIGNKVRVIFYTGRSAGAVTGSTVIISSPMLIANPFPVPYVATSRSAITNSYAHRLPPSGKFIIDCEFFPYWNFDTAVNEKTIYGWISGLGLLSLIYESTTDKFALRYRNSANVRYLRSQQFYASTLNSYHRFTASLDLTTGGTTGSQFYVDGVPVDSAWDDVIEVQTVSSMTTLYAGYMPGGPNPADGIFRKLQIYGGSFASTETYTTEAELDSALADRQLLFDQTYQRRFDMDTVAIMGHNISEGAAITMQANDFNEWNYTDGSGSSIIQHALTWDDETILKMITATKKQYVKFTINDPNNDDAKLKIGRFWLGRYLDIDPASLDNFTVKKKRTDDVTMGVNMQKFAAVGTKYREFDLKFPQTCSTMVTAIQTMYDHVGNHSSVLFCNFDTLRNYEIVEPVYCSIVGDLSFTHKGRQKYEYGLRLQENK